MANFVLVHGAWHGAWCWRRVVDLLQAQGHRVHALTLTGLGERAHLLSPDIHLSTHIQDVVLAVHSYAGMVATGHDPMISAPKELTEVLLGCLN